MKKKFATKYSIETALNYNEAEKLIKKECFDHMFLDLNVPGKKGDQFIKEQRNRGLKTPATILSAISSEESIPVMQSIMNKGVGFLNKNDLCEETVNYIVENNTHNTLYLNKFNLTQIEKHKPKFLMIGGSTGAIPVIKEMLSSCPINHKPIIILQHIESFFMEALGETLCHESCLKFTPIKGKHSLRIITFTFRLKNLT